MKSFLKYALMFIFGAAVLVGCSESKSEKHERLRIEEAQRKNQEKRAEEREAMIIHATPIYKVRQDILTSPRRLLQHDESSQARGRSWFKMSSIEITNTMVNQRIMFIWERNPGEYIFSEVPLSILQLKLIEDGIDPTLEFQWKRKPEENYESYEYFGKMFNEINGCLEPRLKAVTLSIPKSDWPSGVRLSADVSQ